MRKGTRELKNIKRRRIFRWRDKEKSEDRKKEKKKALKEREFGEPYPPISHMCYVVATASLRVQRRGKYVFKKGEIEIERRKNRETIKRERTKRRTKLKNKKSVSTQKRRRITTVSTCSQSSP
jgi:hypothetical protein